MSRALRAGEWVVSVQLDPPLGGNSAGLVEVAARLNESGRVGWVDINDNATARAGMSSLMVSATIERRADIETIPHLTTRDWSVMGLESMLLGAHAEGVRNVLAITGDPPEVGDYPGRPRRVRDRRDRADAADDEPQSRRGLQRPSDRRADVVLPRRRGQPDARRSRRRARRFEEKLEAGAKFAMTQIVFDLEPLDRFAEQLGGEWPIPILVGIFPLTSHRLALRLHNEVPGIIVPQSLQDALQDAGASRRRGRLRACTQAAAEEARRFSASVSCCPPFRRPLRVLELLAD